MSTYIDDISTQARDNADAWLSGRAPAIGSIEPLPIFFTAPGEEFYRRAERVANAYRAQSFAVRGLSGGYSGASIDYDKLRRELSAETERANRLAKALTQIIYFQYFPDSISDSRELNISEMRPFFLSDSIPTFTGPSERRLSFRIRFTRERWVSGKSLRDDEWDKYNVDVALAVQAVRSLVYPTAQIGIFGITPQPVRLTLPGTGIGIDVNIRGRNFSDSIVGLITSYAVEYTSFFPDGQPRIADIDLSFSEYPAYDLKNITRDNFAKVLGEFSSRMLNFISPKSIEHDFGDNRKATDIFGVTKKTDVSRGWTIDMSFVGPRLPRR